MGLALARAASLSRGAGHVPARSTAPGVNDQTVCLTDLLATCAALTGAKVPRDAGEDSFSFLPALTGADDGVLQLRGLVALGQVGVKVVLALEHRSLVDLAVVWCSGNIVSVAE